MFAIIPLLKLMIYLKTSNKGKKIMKDNEVYVKLDDGNSYRLHYVDWGQLSDKTLVCVHGLTRNCRDFDYLAKKLVANHGYRVISIDMFGRGKSDYLPDAKMYNYANYYLATLHLLDQLKLESIDYIGSSMGGILAMQLAQNRPSLFNKLILNDVGTFLSKASLARIAKDVRVYPSFLNLERAKEHLKIKLANFGIRSEENWNYITQHSLHKNDINEYILNYDLKATDSMLAFFDQNATDLDLSELWKTVNYKKLLILRGKNSDILTHQNALAMTKQKENATLIEFENTAHAPALIENDQLAPVIDWLVN